MNARQTTGTNATSSVQLVRGHVQLTFSVVPNRQHPGMRAGFVRGVVGKISTPTLHPEIPECVDGCDTLVWASDFSGMLPVHDDLVYAVTDIRLQFNISPTR